MREAAKRYWANAPSTDKRREKLAEQNRSDEARQRVINAQIKRWSNPEAHEHMSNALKGRPKNEEHRQKISESLTGRQHSDESRLKMSESHKARWTSEERQRQSDARKGLKYKTRKDKGTKRGPLETSVTCPTCNRTMKFITKLHRCT